MAIAVLGDNTVANGEPNPEDPAIGDPRPNDPRPNEPNPKPKPNVCHELDTLTFLTTSCANVVPLLLTILSFKISILIGGNLIAGKPNLENIIFLLTLFSSFFVASDTSSNKVFLSFTTFHPPPSLKVALTVIFELVTRLI